MPQPNFIVICTDQQRADSLGCYGNPIVRSPNIDTIAANGARFTRHITPMQICSPSRATMVTGMYPRHHRLVTNGMALPEEWPTLPGVLADNGYRTHSVGKQHLQPLLAPSECKMPDSRAFWQSPEARHWNGPYYGYQTLDLLLGEADTAHLAGHYANWLAARDPAAYKLLLPENSPMSIPHDLDEIWQCALPVELHYNSWISDNAARFIEQQSAAQPYFLFVSYPDPHHPFAPPVEYATRYDYRAMPLPRVDKGELQRLPPYCRDLYPLDRGFRASYWSADEGLEAGALIMTDRISASSLKKAIAHTYAMIEMIDDGVGKILRALKQSGRADNTYLIFTSDHGEYLGQHGLLHKGPASYRQLTEISFLISGPGIAPGLESRALTNHIDLAPTLLDLAAPGRALANADGLSLKPLLTGKQASLRQYNLGEYHPTVKKDLYNQTIQTPTWRLTLYPNHPEWGELFNLDHDPEEHNNRFHDPKNRALIAELRQYLRDNFAPMPVVDNRVLGKW